jgi:hypothetical protein
VSYGIVGVQPIDVQQVDALVAEVFNSLVERCPQELRKGGVALLVVPVHFLEHRFVVQIGVRVALPRIDRITLARGGAFLDCLTHPEVRLAVVSAEFDEE